MTTETFKDRPFVRGKIALVAVESYQHSIVKDDVILKALITCCCGRFQPLI